ncbi:6f4b0f52-f400-45b4-944f-7b39cfc028fd [Thermothielavioides terrestris]|uniref:6f4b0f52-f400-45b4-944f-7b39cfc028fd n=1 Tax=Thermothielavioides terrestris TaxID=2587410 RepID=A0A3S4EWC0_9PEZI|nr:6f4b0f52-f400-45b4-944f-7b39cfc028fd [Thermothielavioides terrestris]
MVPPPSQPPARTGMSLYANLLETDSSASISRDPVLFKDEATAKKAIDSALRFQPIRRPQVKQPAKAKPGFPKAPPAVPPAAAAAAASPAAAGAASTAAPAQPRSTLADWAATEEDEYLYGTGEKRQRGGRRKKKKKAADDAPRETNWDELYDPARPTNVEEYLRSEERIREVQEWKAVLYAHRRRRTRGGSDESERRSEGEEEERPGLGNQFAPPASLTFAPPPMSPPRAAAPVPDDATGEDAYARRLALLTNPSSPTAPPTDTATISRAPVRYDVPPPPPPNEAMDLDDDDDEDDYDPASIPLPPTTTASTLPDADADNTDAPRSNRPGQKGFAQRLMAKYGWTKGTGLGASASGITSALRVQVEKRRRRPDAEGGGFAERGGRGRIIAPKAGKPPSQSQSQSQSESAGQQDQEGASGGRGGGGSEEGGEDGKFGKVSAVVVLHNMLENMPDLEAEVEAGLGQEIGEECGEQYGRVERVLIDVEGRRVFIKFVDPVSALRAVNALEQRVFNGNSIAARFYDEEKFEEGIYDG